MSNIKPHLDYEVEAAWENLPAIQNIKQNQLVETMRLGQYLQAHDTIEEAVDAFIGNDDDGIDRRRTREALGLDDGEDLPLNVTAALALISRM